MTLTELKSSSHALQVQRSMHQEGAVMMSRICGCEGIRFYICVRPDSGGSFADQVNEIYRKLGCFLDEQGAKRHHVITEKVFCSDLKAQAETFRKVRERFYLEGNGKSGSPPATTYLQQPPCEPGVLCELQAQLVLSSEEESVEVREVEGLPAPAAGKIVSSQGYDHVYLHNLTGGQYGDGMDYTSQTEEVFDLAEDVLEQQGLTFKDVVRTWLYVDEMERDYAALNRVRNAFFERVGLESMPASTGIQGGVYPCDRGGSLDLYALRTNQPVEVEVMHAPTLNEAWSYGSSFSRGMTVTCEHRTVAYISGTASIDTTGQVVHVGDIEGQVHRMLLNVEELLAGSGAGPGDIVRATTYLKDGRDFDLFKRIYAEHGFPLEVPHTICEADVCRPEWLVEIEAAAIFPPARDS